MGCKIVKRTARAEPYEGEPMTPDEVAAIEKLCDLKTQAIHDRLAGIEADVKHIGNGSMKELRDKINTVNVKVDANTLRHATTTERVDWAIFLIKYVMFPTSGLGTVAAVGLGVAKAVS